MAEPSSSVETDREVGRARFAGAVAGVLGLSVLWLCSSLLDGVPFAPASLAETIIRATPGGVATFFIETFQHLARPLLTLVVLAGSVALAATALGRTARDRAPNFIAVGVGIGMLAALAMLASPNQSADAIPVLIAVALAAASYIAAARGIYSGGAALQSETDLGRRRTIRLGAGAALGLSLGSGIIGWIARSFQGPNTDVALIDPALAATIPDREPFPDIPGLTPEVTSAADHYVVDINIVQPSVEADEWTLRVFGDVDSSLELTFKQLQSRFEVVEEYSVLTCVSNEVGGPLIGHSAWGGVRLREVLDGAGVKSDAVDIVFRAADGYSDSIPLGVAQDPSTLIAVSQNGDPLTQEHGFPCRVRVPAIYGMKNVKWLESIEVVPIDYEGYWQDRGWSDEAVVKTESRIDVAGDDDAAKVGEPTWIAGVAWAGDRGVSKVEVSTDGGDTWNEARLKDPISDLSWRLWAYRWTPDRTGEFTVRCRATDGTGSTQTMREADPHPDGASGFDAALLRVS